MIEDKKCIAVIPARSGSKGIKDKNIRLLNGKPLIAYTIEFAKSIKIIDHIIVSTDSKKYAQIAKKFGAEVPFIRPKELAQDNSKGIDVTLHAAKWIVDNIDNAAYYIRLQPTSPFRKKEDIENILRIFKEKNADVIMSMCEVDFPPQWMFSLTQDLKLVNIFNEEPPHTRQDCEKYYRANGAFYFAKISFLLEKKTFLTEKTYAYLMPTIRSIDIDTEIDFKFAEFLLKTKSIII